MCDWLRFALAVLHVPLPTVLYVSKLHYKSITGNPCIDNYPTYFITILLYQPGVQRNKND